MTGFYLDEHLSQRIAEMLRARGYDVASSHELRRDGLSDEEQLRLAAQDDLCLVTRNYADFEELTRRFREQGKPHAGVLFIPASIGDDDFAGLARAIASYAECGSTPAPYYIGWLKPADTWPSRSEEQGS